MPKLSEASVAFEISERNGCIEGAWFKGARILEECHDCYILSGASASAGEETDEVTDVQVQGNHIRLDCRNPVLNIDLRKEYTLEGRMLKKKVTVLQHPGEAFLHLRSSVVLSSDFRADSYYYTPTNNWHHDTKKDPVGLIKADQLECPHKFVTGFDNRMVTAFNPGAGIGLGHYRYKVNDVFAPFMTQTTDIITQASEDNLCYTQQGWDFDVLIVGPKDRERLSSEVHFTFYEGDYYDFVREYKQNPDFKEAHEFDVPEWTKEIKLVAFTIPNHPELEAEAKYFGELADAIGEGYVAPVINFWSYSGDYETSGSFPIEAGPPGNPRFNSANWDLKTVEISAEWLRNVISEMRKNEKVKVGLYVQGMLIEKLSRAFRENPEWAVTTPDGQPMFSGMKDHGDGALYHFDPSNEGLVSHLLSRFEELMRYYDASWLHFDGGVTSDMHDYRTEKAILPSHCIRFHKETRNSVKKAGRDKALMMNAASHPYGEMCYQETSFTFETPISDDLLMDGQRLTWRSVTDIMLFTKMMQTGNKATVPLYWGTETAEKVYLPLLIAFGFTPEMRKWMDIDWVKERSDYLQAAYLLRDSEFIFSSEATSPLWWKDGSEVETFALSLGENRIVPVFNHSQCKKDIMLRVDVKSCGINDSLPVFAWALKPFGGRICEPLGWFDTSKGGINIPLQVDKEYHNARIVVLSHIPAYVYSINGERQPVFLAGCKGVDVESVTFKPDSVRIALRCDREEVEIIFPQGVRPTFEGKFEQIQIDGYDFSKALLRRGINHLELQYDCSC